MSSLRSKEELREGGVSLLGNQNTRYETDYNPEVLETFENKHPDNDYVVSFDAYEFTSLCVSGDTLIDIATNEVEYPHGVPIRDLVGTQGYVFGVDPSTLEPVCRAYKAVKKTGENVPVVKIVMDCIRNNGNGSVRHETSSLVCTRNHPILVKRGFHHAEWIEAADLKPGMRLIADQRTFDTIRNKSRHRLIGEAIFGKNLDVVHHMDGNHFNNCPDNLANLSMTEHFSLHRLADYGYEDSLDVDYLVNLYNSGENFASIAKMFDCDVSTITRRIGALVEKRSQAESLSLRNRKLTEDRDDEICRLYDMGYLLSEISDYMQIHSTTVSEVLQRRGIARRESNLSRYNRRKLDLPALNHKVVAVVDAGLSDVYNMEVEDVENYFANEVVVHNCPITSQPDMAKVVISYIPNKLMVESKSLKLYLFSFRNHGDFHEDCMNIIMKDLIKLMDPKYIEVKGIFAPRGGISIYPAVNWANPNFEYAEYAKQRQLDFLRDASNRTVKYDM